MKFQFKYDGLHSEKCIWKCPQQNRDHFFRNVLMIASPTHYMCRTWLNMAHLCMDLLTKHTCVRLQSLPWYKTGLVSRQVLHLLSKLQNWICPKTEEEAAIAGKRAENSIGKNNKFDQGKPTKATNIGQRYWITIQATTTKARSKWKEVCGRKTTKRGEPFC